MYGARFLISADDEQKRELQRIIATNNTCPRMGEWMAEEGGKFAMTRRCRLNIVIEILGMISSGTTKTKIVYETNPNFNIATKYLDLLQEKKLIRKM
jgi:hypothetical protein